jgi:hypothetical protein
MLKKGNAMNNHLESLKAACRATGVPSESERIREGETLWLAGFAVPAEAGHIGLSMGEGHAVIVSEASIVEVDKDQDLYLVRVKVGATAFVRTETTTTIRHELCDCSEGSPRSIAAVRTDTGGGGSGSGGFCLPFCDIVAFCTPYRDKSGRVRRACVLAPVCGMDCGPLV